MRHLALVFLVACGVEYDVTGNYAYFPLPEIDALGEGGTQSLPQDTDPLLGWIGSPCETVADCPYEDAVCLLDSEGFPAGTCSLACDQYCPDADGYPMTFCADIAELPPAVSDLGDGGCLSRCDFSAYPATGCRADYGCAAVTRANEPETQQFTCMPGATTDLSSCQLDLAARGVVFSPTIIADRSPEDYPELTCHVEDPVVIHTPLFGVDLIYSDGDNPTDVKGSCEMAHALADTILDVEPEGVETLRHYGTYNCRVIAGTNTLSRHSMGDAIDIMGFDFADGRSYTLYDDWEHDRDNPVGDGGAFLYDAANRWHDDYVWNIILTPNYNLAHDNHFHVDLTPGSDFMGFWDGRYIGPALYVD